jgi:hypothetical protein
MPQLAALGGVGTDGSTFNVLEGNHALNLAATYSLRPELGRFVNLTGDYREADSTAGFAPSNSSKKEWLAIEAYGTLGNARRRVFYGPGIENFDLTLQKNIRLAESKSLEFRAEAFNAFNHEQFYGPASVDGQVDDTQHFGDTVSAAAPRLAQLVAKFNF